MLIVKEAAEFDRANEDGAQQWHYQRHFRRRRAAPIAKKASRAHHLIKYGTSRRTTCPAVEPEPPAVVSLMIST